MNQHFNGNFQAIHDGLNCKQYQDQLSNDTESESAKQTKQLLQDLIDKEEALNCPTCHVGFGTIIEESDD
jgi:RanBP-type and C3HC4-type zinc finger-containing protein 1